MIDYTPITNSSQYSTDLGRVNMDARKRVGEIYRNILMLVVPPLWPVGIYLYIKNNRKRQQSIDERDRLTADFAAANGFTFAGRSELLLELLGVDKSSELNTAQASLVGRLDASRVRNSAELPYIFSRQDTSSSRDDAVVGRELSGTISGLAFSYQFAGLPGYDNLAYILLTVDLPVTLPRMFINAKRNNLSGIDAKPNNFKRIEGRTLEGDFSQYYDVNIEKNEQIDMYTVLTPEVMDELKHNDMYDVWLNGTQLMLITFGDEARYFAGIPSAFKHAEMLLHEVDRIARAVRKHTQSKTPPRPI